VLAPPLSSIHMTPRYDLGPNFLSASRFHASRSPLARLRNPNLQVSLARSTVHNPHNPTVLISLSHMGTSRFAKSKDFSPQIFRSTKPRLGTRSKAHDLSRPNDLDQLASLHFVSCQNFYLQLPNLRINETLI
jgi:hypothetical protein